MDVAIRQARPEDLEAICQIYENIHAAEEQGLLHTGWKRGIYPVRQTAEAAIGLGEMFVLFHNGAIAGNGIINQKQVDVYKQINWKYKVEDCQITVLHTFMIDPLVKAKGLGRKFIEFYEQLAINRNAPFLRLDTNAINSHARQFYKKLNYEEKGCLRCSFNGLSDVNLVMLEKKTGEPT